MIGWATYAERPDLATQSFDGADIWPEYNLHGDVVGHFWGRLDEFPDHQFVVFDASGTTEVVLGSGHAVPCPWDGTDAGLPAGIDAALTAAFDGRRGGALCALAAEVAPSARGEGVSRALLGVMRTIALRDSLPALIAPVRPSWKDRYPTVDITDYVRWRRADGWLFDPWMRVHERLGGRLVRVAPRSMQITGSVSEWEGWTQLSLPVSGRYVFPRGLTLLEVDRDSDTATYWEPNVWFVHDTRPQDG